jgi:hypothetical protein
MDTRKEIEEGIRATWVNHPPRTADSRLNDQWWIFHDVFETGQAFSRMAICSSIPKILFFHSACYGQALQSGTTNTAYPGWF